MKRFLFFISALVFTLSVNAQAPRISVAANIGAPTTTGLSLAFGVDVQADFWVAEPLDITASAGYENYTWKGGGGSFGFIPLLAGAKFSLGSEKVYGHAQIGYGISTANGGGGALAYAPSIGYYFNPNLDGSIKYLAFSKKDVTTGSVNFRIAYNF